MSNSIIPKRGRTDLQPNIEGIPKAPRITYGSLGILVNEAAKVMQATQAAQSAKVGLLSQIMSIQLKTVDLNWISRKINEYSTHLFRVHQFILTQLNQTESQNNKNISKTLVFMHHNSLTVFRDFKYFTQNQIFYLQNIQTLLDQPSLPSPPLSQVLPEPISLNVMNEIAKIQIMSNKILNIIGIAISYGNFISENSQIAYARSISFPTFFNVNFVDNLSLMVNSANSIADLFRDFYNTQSFYLNRIHSNLTQPPTVQLIAQAQGGPLSKRNTENIALMRTLFPIDPTDQPTQEFPLLPLMRAIQDLKVKKSNDKAYINSKEYRAKQNVFKMEYNQFFSEDKEMLKKCTFLLKILERKDNNPKSIVNFKNRYETLRVNLFKQAELGFKGCKSRSFCSFFNLFKFHDKLHLLNTSIWKITLTRYANDKQHLKS